MAQSGEHTYGELVTAYTRAHNDYLSTGSPQAQAALDEGLHALVPLYHDPRFRESVGQFIEGLQYDQRVQSGEIARIEAQRKAAMDRYAEIAGDPELYQGEAFDQERAAISKQLDGYKAQLTKPSVLLEEFELDGDLAGLAAVASPESIRNQAILSADILTDQSGSRYVTDDRGIPWDMEEPLRILNQPETRAAIARSMRGVESEGFLYEAAAGMGMSRAIRRRLDIGTSGMDVPTSDPAMTLPFLIPLGEGGSTRGDELEQWREDPALARALNETLQDMADKGELDPSFWQSLWRTAGFLGDFTATMATTRGALGGASKVAAAGGGRLLTTEGGRAIAKLMATRTGQHMVAASTVGRGAFPMSIGAIRTPMEFGAYEALIASTDPEDSRGLVEAVLEGGEMGLGVAAAGAVLRPLRRVTVTPLLNKIMASKAGQGAPASIEQLLARVDTSRATAGLSKLVAEAKVSGGLQKTLEHAVDGYMLGLALEGYGWAASQEAWGTADFTERVALFGAGMMQPSTQGAALAFFASPFIQAEFAKHKATDVERLAKDPNFRKEIRTIAAIAAGPRFHRDRSEWIRAIEEFRKAEPDLFKGIKVEKLADFEAREAKRIETEKAEAAAEKAAEDARLAAGEYVNAAGEVSFPKGEGAVKAAEALGFQHPKHLLNSIKKRLGRTYKSLETVRLSAADLQFLLNERYTEIREHRGRGNFLGPEQRTPTLGEAGDLYNRYRAEPWAVGMAPREILERALRVEIRPPDVGEAIRRYSRGEITRREMELRYPEVAELVGNPRDLSWVGNFERALRAGGTDALPEFRLFAAGESARMARNALVEARVIPEGTKVMDAVSQIKELRDPNSAVAKQIGERLGPVARDRAVESAGLAYARTLDATEKLIAGGDPRYEGVGRAAQRLIDGEGTQKELAADRKRLRDVGLLKRGQKTLGPDSVEMLYREMESRLADAVSTHERLRDQPIADIPLGISFGDRLTEPIDGRISRALSLQNLTQLTAKTGLLNLAPIKALVNALAKVGGVYQGALITTREAETNRRFLSESFTPQKVKQMERQAAAMEILQMATGAFGGLTPPMEHIRLLDRLFNTGRWSKMSGPKDLERLEPGTGYLWEIGLRLSELWAEVGRDSVALGLLSDAQFRRMAGNYIPRTSLNAAQDHWVSELSTGNVPSSLFGFSMARKGESATRHTIEDPFLNTLNAIGGQSVVQGWFAGMKHLRDGAYTLDAAQYASLPAYERSRYTEAASTMKGARWGAFATGTVLRKHGERMQSVEDWKAGKKLKPGEVPYTPEMRGLVDFYLGENGAPKRYVPKKIAELMDVTTAHTFDVQMGAGLVGFFNHAARWAKGNLTTKRPKHWTLNTLSNVSWNHAMGRVPMTDLARGLITGRGAYAEAAKGILALERWNKEGRPAERPAEGWTAEQWRNMELARDSSEHMLGGTYVAAGLETNIAGEMLGGVFDPARAREGLVAQAEAKYGKLDPRSELAGNILGFVKGMDRGNSSIERKIADWTGASDPVGKAKSLDALMGQYQMLELFFKHAAALKGMSRHPTIDRDRIYRWASMGTGDFENASPWMQRINGAYMPGTGVLGQAAYKNRGVRGGAERLAGRAAWMAMQGRFWHWQSIMIPQAMRAVVRHPFHAAFLPTAMASTFAGFFQYLSVNDPEEAYRWQEAEAYSRTSVMQPRPLPERDQELMRRRWGNAGGGALAFGSLILDKAMSGWERLRGLNPFRVAAPTRGGRSRTMDVSPTAGPIGEVAERVEAIGTIIEDGAASEPARDAVKNLFGIQSQLMLGAAIGAKDLVYSGFGRSGRQTPDEIVMDGVRAGLKYLPTLHPTFGPIADTNVKAMEILAFGGLSVDDYFRGLRRAYTPEGINDQATDLALNAIWTSRATMQHRALGGGDTQFKLASELLGRADGAQTEQQQENSRAATLFRQQLALVIEDAYNEFQTSWDGTSLDYVLSKKLDIFTGWEPDGSAAGRRRIKEGAEESSDMMAFIARQPEELHDEMLRYGHDFLTREDWRVGALGVAAELGRKRRMDTGLFGETIDAVLRDPGGANFMAWLHGQITDGDRATVEQLAPFIQFAVDVPTDADSQAGRAYLDILQRLIEEGIEVGDTPMPHEIRQHIEEFERTRRRKFGLQGGRAALIQSAIRAPAPERPQFLAPQEQR